MILFPRKHHTVPFRSPWRRRVKPFFVSIGLTCWLAAIIVVLVPVFPYFLYRLSPSTPNQLAQNIASTAQSNDNRMTTDDNRMTVAMPPLDTSLPITNTLSIPSIGVNGPIHQGSDWESILRQGIWIVPNFATPDDGRHPIILAAHRWGYLDWSASFRRLNSFYNLPKVKDGDQVQIVWNQHQYTYAVYKSENSTFISDYSADLILYTCELWNSPTRVLRYAKRV